MRGALTTCAIPLAAALLAFAGCASAATQPTPSQAVTSCQGNVCCSAEILIVNGKPAEKYSRGANFVKCQRMSDSLGARTSADQLRLCALSAKTGAGGFYSLAGIYTYSASEVVHGGNRCDQKSDAALPANIVQSPIGSVPQQSLGNGSSLAANDAPGQTAPSSDMQQYLATKNTLVNAGMSPQDAAQQMDQLANGTPQQQQAAQTTITQQLRSAGFSDEQIAQIVHPDVASLSSGTIDTPGSQAAPSQSPISSSDSAPGSPISQCGFSGIADKLMLPESGCGKSLGSGTYQGPLQFSCASWNSYANATGNPQYADCNYRMDPTISAQITNEYDAQMQQRYGTRCQSDGLSWDSCGLAIHAWGEGGFRQMLGATEANPNASALSWCGGGSCANQSYLMRYNPDGSMQGAFSSLDKFMTCGWSCNSSGVVPPGAYLGNANTAALQPPAISSANYTYVPSNSTASIGGGSSPLGSGYSPLMGMLGSSLFSPFSSLMNNLRTNVAQQQAAAPAPAPTPTLSLSVTPETLQRGQSISISWTSTGMSSAAPCSVVQNGSTIASANAGARSVATNASTTPGTIAFRLVCQAAGNGQIFQQNASSVVQ